MFNRMRQDPAFIVEGEDEQSAELLLFGQFEDWLIATEEFA
jgi:hypothetical protein